MFEGYLLIGIKVEANKEIVLSFHMRAGEQEIDDETALQMKANGDGDKIVEDGQGKNKKYYRLNLHVEICDQLISGMGQDASMIRKLVAEFDQADLALTKGYDGHSVSINANKGLIRFHGAMANFITTDFNIDLTENFRKSNLPRNSNDPNIMPCVLPKLFSFFSASDHQRRVSINVNTCFLQRGDLRDKPTEFEEFLTKADLTQSEIKSFVQFLKEQRANDATGAGVSCENLNQYVNSSDISDRIAVVSSCTIISTEDAGYPDEDGFNPTVLHSLLYDAVPYPAVLKVLLQDKRIDPHGINNDAFYRCLYSGSIAGLKCFQECDRFIFPDNTLIKAAELGGNALMEYLLSLNFAESGLFSRQLDQALIIAEEHNDKVIIDMLHEARRKESRVMCLLV